MKFGEIYKDSMIGETRIIEKFLYAPVTIDSQTRWLEHVKIRQICKYYGEDYGYHWENYEWIDNEPTKKRGTIQKKRK